MELYVANSIHPPLLVPIDQWNDFASGKRFSWVFSRKTQLKREWVRLLVNWSIGWFLLSVGQFRRKGTKVIWSRVGLVVSTFDAFFKPRRQPDLGQDDCILKNVTMFMCLLSFVCECECASAYKRPYVCVRVLCVRTYALTRLNDGTKKSILIGRQQKVCQPKEK